MRKAVIPIIWLLLLLIPASALAAPPPAPRDWDKLAPEGELLDTALASVQSSILVDARTGKVLFEKNADEQRAPASLTKIMTCLIALEKCELTDQVTICDLDDLAKDASVAGFKEGEVLTMEDVLYGLMLESGGDAALAIAVHIAGSVEAFSDMMNERAAQLGMDNTRFTNPHGLTQEGHYSTARDLAILTLECMKYPKFRKIVSTYQYTCYPTNKSSKNNELINTNRLVNPSDSEKYAYGNAIGVKTGYTSAAGYCLASAATKGDMELIAIALNGSDYGRYVDSITMFEYGFAFYDSLDVQGFLSSEPLSIPISKAALDDPGQGYMELLMVPDGPAWITGKKETIATLKNDPDRFKKSVELVPNLTAPIKKGDEVGTVTFSLDGKPALTCSLMASRDMEAQPEPTPDPSATVSPTAGRTAAPEPTPLPDPYLPLGWIRYALVGLAVLIAVPVTLILLARMKRERQHKHYRYKNRRR